MCYHQRRRKSADRRRRSHPAESDRAAVQDLIREDRHQRGRAAEQNRKQVEGDRGENHFSLEHKSESRDDPFPRARRNVIQPLPAATDRKNQKEKHERAKCVQQIYKRKADICDEESTDSWPDNRTNLKNAVVPSHCICKRVARNKRRKEGTARRPTERARR